MIYAEEEIKFVTCDFDLDPEVQPRLPTECQNLDALTRESLTREAESFKAFNEKLLEYEKSFNKDTEEDIYKDWEFRAKLYGEAELNSCHNNTDILEEYLDCLKEKREVMVLEIEKKMTNNN